MEKITEWDYTMTGDEFELVSEWARNAYGTMSSFFMIIGAMK
ncbi:hypothetical protein [Campylobacter corcagiensis]|nr:hypothetical protein [Campylobacter corcagiensis]